MKRSPKAISCAVTGSAHTPSMSDHLPITPDEIATHSVDAVRAGAAIVHLHARDPLTGQPPVDPEVFMKFLPRIRAETDAVVNITTGGALTMSIDDRLAAARRARPELASAAADRFRLPDRGRIAPGRQADLLMVDGGPTVGIVDTLLIRAVWRRGHRLDRMPPSAVVTRRTSSWTPVRL